MGTSNAYGGPGGGTPLVPTWLEPDPAGTPAPSDAPDGSAPPVPPMAPPDRPVPLAPAPGRFTGARGNFSRFAGSGGRDRASLGRAVANYVSTASGGARQAARRMGSSHDAGARLLSFLADAAGRGAREALRALNLESLAGRPLEDIFLGLADYVCPDGGTVDEGIARDAFIETIAELAGLGITDLDALNPDQVQTVFELYATHAIEGRICNDIGTRAVILPADVRAVEGIQAQLRDFVRRGVSDALTAARAALEVLTPEQVLAFVGGIYESAFAILRAIGEAEAAA